MGNATSGYTLSPTGINSDPGILCPQRRYGPENSDPEGHIHSSASRKFDAVVDNIDPPHTPQMIPLELRKKLSQRISTHIYNLRPVIKRRYLLPTSCTALWADKTTTTI